MRAARLGASFGGSQNHEVNSALASDVGERLVGVAALEVNALRKAVFRRAFGTHLDGERAHVDGLDGGGAAARGPERDSADVTERVEHAAVARELFDARAQRALVEIEASLLSELEWNAKGEAALAKRKCVECCVAADYARARLEALALGGALRRAIDDRLRLELRERFENGGFALLEPERSDLDAQHRPEAIDDEPRYLVALGVDQPIRVGVGAWQSEPRATPDGALDALGEQRAVDGARAVARVDAHGDRGARRVEPAPERLPARIEHLDVVAGTDAALDALDRLREHPRVPGPNRLNVAGLENHGAHWGLAYHVGRARACYLCSTACWCVVLPS